MLQQDDENLVNQCAEGCHDELKRCIRGNALELNLSLDGLI
jgi:hypothetical protein